MRPLRVGLLHRVPPDGRGPARPDPAPRRLHLRGRRHHRRPRQHLGSEIVSLADYRRRYALYKTDPDLQAAHAIAPWLVVPDDHEVENNYANMVRADNSPALTAAQWTARRTAAYQAYYENMPLRPAAAPSGNSIPLYRRVRWGTLATFHMLDTRQFRDDQACGDGWKVCADADLASRTPAGRPRRRGCSTASPSTSAPGTSSASRCSSPGSSTRPGRRTWTPGTATGPPGPGSSRAGSTAPCATRSCSPATCTRPGPTTSRPTTPTRRRRPSAAELVCTSITSGGDGNATTTIPERGHQPAPEVLLRPARLRPHHDHARRSSPPTSGAVAKVTEHGAAASTLRSFVIHDGQPGLQAGVEAMHEERHWPSPRWRRDSSPWSPPAAADAPRRRHRPG